MATIETGDGSNTDIGPRSPPGSTDSPGLAAGISLIVSAVSWLGDDGFGPLPAIKSRGTIQPANNTHLNESHVPNCGSNATHMSKAKHTLASVKTTPGKV
jgi:hypothetical protein